MAYLRPDTKCEPLVQDWYAWCHLIAPAPMAMNFAYRYLPTLQSFVSNPAVHVSASADPTMFGGPFVSLPLAAKAEAEALRRTIERDLDEVLSLARQTRAFDQVLQEEASGHCLEAFEPRVPNLLSGRVEMLYDGMNRPRLRFIEELFSDSALSGAGHQSLRISREREEDRDFFLSTPRLPRPDELRLRLPFADRRHDLLARMRTEDLDPVDVSSALGLDDDQKRAFEDLLQVEPPPRRAPHASPDQVRIRYFGHACVLIQTPRTAILIDPLISADGAVGDGRFSLCDLPDVIDHVVITHGHQDHLVPETLLQIRHKVRNVVTPRTNGGALIDPSLKLMLRALGFDSIQVVDPFDEIAFADGRIVSLPFPGEHCDLDIHSRQGLLVEARDLKVLFLVDSRASSDMLYRRIAERIGPVDVAFIGMECDGAPLTWLYGPLLTKAPNRKDDESRRMSSSNAEQAVAVLKRFDVGHAYVYAMGQEPWLRYIMGLEYAPDSVQLKECEKLAGLCAEAGIPLTRLNLAAEITR
ncbi:MAG TPA: MBL fold metallo-hydrolase [Caulobacter sp.]|nr:MBL fold metallo-hydrolase [Caulobacter sp.]